MSDVSALNQGQIIAMLGAASLTLQSNLHGLSGRVLTWHPEPTAWCIQQVLGHVIETEQTGFAGRIRTMLERSDPHLAASQPLARVLTRRDCERDAAELLDEFVTLRTGSITFVEGLRDVDLVRGGWHPDIGYVLVVDLLHEWVYHDHDHIRQMMANVQRYLWPHLGSTQKFYGA